MALSRLFPPEYVFHTADGQDPNAAGLVHFYVNNTSNLATVYTDLAGTIPSSNPVTLGADGRLPSDIYTAVSLRVKVSDLLSAQISQDDNVSPLSAIENLTELASIAASGGSALIGFINSGTGATARTVQAKLRDNVSPLDFGATGDGLADDTAELQLVINAAAGKWIDLQGLTYKVSTTLTGVSNMRFRNGTLSFATAADDDVMFECYGSIGTLYTLTGAAPVKGAASVAVASATGIAAGDNLIVLSNDNFSALDSGKRGEWVRVLSVSGLTINLEQRLRHTYATGHALYKPVPLTNIVFDGVHFIGSGNTASKAQYALRAYMCKGVWLSRCTADGFGYAAYSIESVLGGHVIDCEASRGNFSLGTAYGVSITGGCEGITVKGGRYSYLRHGVSIGGTHFTAYGITVTGVTTFACSDAGVDFHPNTMACASIGCVIDNYSTDTSQQGDGIVAQGAAMTIVGNQVKGWRRHGILCQPLTSAIEGDDSWAISGNILSNAQGVSGADAIVFSSEKDGVGIRGVAITGNVINAQGATTGKGIAIYNTTTGGPIRTITISGNAIQARSEALYIAAANLQIIDDVAIAGNSLATLSTSLSTVTLVSNAEVSKYLTAITVSSNCVRGGNYGILLTNAPTKINASANSIQGWTTGATSGTIAESAGANITS